MSRIKGEPISSLVAPLPVVEGGSEFNALVEANADGIVVLDYAGRIAFLNEATARIFSRRREELLGYHLGFPLASTEQTEVKILHPAGDFRTVEIRSVPINWRGAPALLASIRDISDRKSVENQLKEANWFLENI